MTSNTAYHVRVSRVLGFTGATEIMLYDRPSVCSRLYLMSKWRYFNETESESQLITVKYTDDSVDIAKLTGHQC